MLLFSDYCLSCLETTTARQGKKVWILNGMKNSTAALLSASTVRQSLQRQGWVLGSMLNCGGKAEPSSMQHCPWGAGPAHWCGRPLQRQSTAMPLGRCTQLAAPYPGALMGVKRVRSYGSSSLLPITAMHCLAKVQPFLNCLFCCNLSWHLHCA